MFVAHGVDPNRRHKDQIIIQVNAVDLDHQQVEARKIGCHPFLLMRARRQRNEAAGGS